MTDRDEHDALVRAIVEDSRINRRYDDEPDWFAEQNTPAAKIGRFVVGLVIAAVFVALLVAMPS
jgi:hypothetical protein